MSERRYGEDVPTISEDDRIRYLHFNSPWIQGAMDTRDPSRLVLEYARQMMAWLLFTDPPKPPQQMGVLGLGAAALVRWCLKSTASRVRVVEWNPQVVAVCHLQFRLPEPGRRLQIDLDDAQAWVQAPVNHDTCPVVMVDLYDGEARGPVCDSLEFYTGCRAVMGEREGVLTVNLFGNHDSFPRNQHHLDQAFDGRVVSLPDIEAGNRVVLAFSGPPREIPVADFLARAEQIEATYGLPARRWARSILRDASAQGRASGRDCLVF